MKKRLDLILPVLLLAAGMLLSLLVGRYPLRLHDLAEILTGRCTDALRQSVFLQIRLPRTLLAALCGLALSLSGWVYQSVFQNPLVSPDVLGVSGGCSVGAIAALLCGFGAHAMQFWALIAGICTVALTLLLAHRIGRHRNVSLLLSGIVIGALADSVIMLCKYAADPSGELAAIEYWLMGSFHTAGWADLRAALPVFAPAFALTLFLRHPTRLLSLGDEEAHSLGVPVTPVKYLALLAATAQVACVVALAGSVSWIGLIVPHLCRLAWGEKNSSPFSVMITGAALLVLADLAARSLTSSEIPISILTSFMGAIFLFGLLVSHRHRIRRELP